MFCLGHCYETSSFHYNGHNYSGNDIDQIDEIIKGKKINKSYLGDLLERILCKVLRCIFNLRAVSETFLLHNSKTL